MHHVILRMQKNLQTVPNMHKTLRNLLTKAWKWFHFERDILVLTIKELRHDVGSRDSSESVDLFGEFYPTVRWIGAATEKLRYQK